ncbi:energy transducer TonB [Sphingomonas montanisoli]|uniref:TonB family protein n=1 Tax=Sphingomonas montanisoli TaxID=2606412 RepID=A0A5D9C4N3_9SPHN|nr:TonB family protein [Sphingomonas montanisoli]TZG26172.1 TonB family protein [Sphingomonas montanisoli]
MAKLWVRTAVLALVCAGATPAFAAPSPEWTGKVRQMLAAKQDYPRAAQVRGDEGTAKLKIDVAADGSLAAVALVQPTGSATLDREAIAVARKVGAFPPPPGGPASVIVPLTWKMM